MLTSAQLMCLHCLHMFRKKSILSIQLEGYNRNEMVKSPLFKAEKDFNNSTLFQREIYFCGNTGSEYQSGLKKYTIKYIEF